MLEVKKCSRSVLAFAMVSFSGMLFAQGQRYFEEPGTKEFTGEMIVRSWQPDELKRRGYGDLAISLMRNRAQQRISARAREYVRATDEWIVIVPVGYNENTFSYELMKSGDYQYAEPNWYLYPARNPNDPQYPQQWHHPVIQSNRAWDLVTGSNSVICALVDTGIDINHPDLSPNRVPGYNSVDRRAEVDGGQVMDLGGHGTHVAGDAAAAGNNGIGVSGIGWNFKIMMCRTSNDSGGGASLDDILDGARWAADHGAKSVSASYSGVGAAAIGTTGTYIKGRGALFCYAAGNDNRDLSGFSYKDCIVVGASNENDQKAGFSAYGKGIHVFAPGTNILSTTLGGGYGGASGTSMSTPVTNGAIAMIFAANPTLTAQQVQDTLESTCDNIGPSTIFGFGRINVYKAIVRARALLTQDIQPTAIKIVQGSYESGSLADIVVPNSSKSYNIASVVQPGLGILASEELTYVVPAAASKLLSLKATFQGIAAQGSLVTAMVYFYNHTTSKFDLVGSSQMNTQSPAMIVRPVTTGFAKYVSSAGICRVMLRAVTTVAAYKRYPVPFSLKTFFAKLSYSAEP